MTMTEEEFDCEMKKMMAALVDTAESIDSASKAGDVKRQYVIESDAGLFYLCYCKIEWKLAQ